MEDNTIDNFLLIINSYPPAVNQNSIRGLEISKNISKEYLTPIILTRKILRREPKNQLLFKQVPTSIRIYRTPVLEVKRKYSLHSILVKILNFSFGLYNYIAWIPFGYSTGKKIYKKNNYKFIFATGPPYWSHIIGYLLKLRFNIPLIVEYRDPWTQLSYAERKLKSSAIEKKIQYMIQTRILKSADMVIAISPALKSFLISKFSFLKHKPVFSVPNGLNIDLHSSIKKKDKNKVILAFTGQLYGKRTGIPLLKIISDLKKEEFLTFTNFSFKIFGIYNQKRMEEIIAYYDIKDLVHLGGFVSRERAFKEIYQCDLAVHIGENINYPTIAFKVWDYLGCRKRILYAGMEDSYTSEFLLKNDLGIIIPIDNITKGKEVLKNTIEKIINGELSNIIEYNKLKKYLWEVRINKLEEKIKEVFKDKINSFKT